MAAANDPIALEPQGDAAHAGDVFTKSRLHGSIKTAPACSFETVSFRER